MPLSEKKKLRKFQALFAEARSLHEAGRQREAADKYLEAALVAPSVWTKHRYIAFDMFCELVEETPTKSDTKILKRHFLRNEEEPALYRAGAAAIIANACFLQESNIHDAAEYLRTAIDYIQNSPPEDNEEVIVFPPYAGRIEGGTTVRTQLARKKSIIQSTLDIAEGRISAQSSLHHEPHDMEARSHPHCQLRVKLGQRTFAGGNHCDGCNKSNEELQMDELLKCSRCKMVFYCSSDCQHLDWKAHHKKECRKKGQIEVGDDMILFHIESRPERINQQLVRVIGTSNMEGKWLVKLHDSDRQLSVSADKLARLRPPSTG